MQQLLCTPLFTSRQAAQIDNQLAEQMSVDAYELMCRAAQASFDAIYHRWQLSQAVRIFAGSGNNGGDGYQLGRLLLDAGYQPELIAVGGIPQKTPAITAYNAYQSAGGRVINIAELEHNDKAPPQLIVDAIFGSGLNREVSGDALAAIRHINAATQPTVALDIPSGLSADTGCMLPDAVRAQLTITFITRKLGLYTCDAKDCCGEVVYDDLQTNLESIVQITPAAWLLDDAMFLPEKTLQQNSHKGDYGHVLVVGGNYGMAGAVRLAGEAAMRCGAGLVSIATRFEHAAPLTAACPVLMVHGVDKVTDIESVLSRADVLVIGPGFGNGDWGQTLFSHLIEAPQCKIIDADALTFLAAEPAHCDSWILTPHPGEAAKLLGISNGAVQNDRLAAGKEIARKFGGICVLKGAGTVICSEQSAVVSPFGSAAMATAGMGDVLSGVIAALLAQCLPDKDARQKARKNISDILQIASARGVYLHALAAEHAAGLRRRGMIASDLMPYLSEQLENVSPYRR